MPKIPFVKMHGLGNDFIVIDDLEANRPAPVTLDLARRMCDRRLGIGADQIIWLLPPQAIAATAADAASTSAPARPPTTPDARVEFLNADGSTAEMCGNGMRAAGLYLYRHARKSGRSRYQVESLAGLKTIEITTDSRGEPLISVDMGAPVLGAGMAQKGEALRLDLPLGETGSKTTREFRFLEVSMGNPHAVFLTDDLKSVPLEELGPLIETHRRFPNRTNVEFVQIRGPQEIQVRVWERGAGITLACGTGACASAVAALSLGLVQGEVQVQLPGGKLQISWKGSIDDPRHSVVMTGPAEEVFRGEFFI